MPERWKGAGRKWTLNEAKSLNIMQIGKLDLQEKAELAQFYYRQFNLRANSFARAMRVPYAFSKIMRDFDDLTKSDRVNSLMREVSLDSPVVVAKGRYRELSEPWASMRNPKQSLTSYILRMQDFFNAKTSTLKGWDSVGYNQDVQLFGTDAVFSKKYGYVIDENGKRRRVEKFGPFVELRPKYRMTDSERVKFWAIVDLAKQAGWLNKFGYSSEQAHRQIASLWLSGELNKDDIDAAYDKIQDILGVKRANERRYPEHAPGVTGDPIQPDGDVDVLEEGDYLDS